MVTEDPSPPLSVIVAPTENGTFLQGALAALHAQRDAPAFEVIVPVDSSIQGIEELRQTHSQVRFVPVQGTAELAESPDIGIAHLAIDKRRAAGLAAARGNVIALTEEHARPQPDWCARIYGAHQAPHPVIGGAIVNSNPRLVNWALYFCDAGRYQNPLPEGPADYVSDVNVSYKREALEQTSDHWREIYHETGLHDELRARGGTLWLSPTLVVHQDRGSIGLGAALDERFAWARLYAGRRTREVSGTRRLLLALGSPLLAGLLPVRQARLALGCGRHRGMFLRALPYVLLMDLLWSIGEGVGYITGRGTPADS